MRTTPAIALQRRRDATAKLVHKLDVFERILNDGRLERLPKRDSVSGFASWEDAELGVSPVSRTILYDDAPSYLPLQQRMGILLDRLKLLRSKQSKKANLDSVLRLNLADAEARAQAYVDQYSTAMAELIEARKEIERLNLKLARQAANRTKVVQLHSVKKDAVTDE